MKKRTSFLLVSILLLISLFFINKTPVFKDFSDEYEVYFNTYSDTASIKTINIYEYPFTFSIKGESCVIKNKEFNIDDFFSSMNAKLLFSEEVDGVKCYYAYSTTIKYLKIVNNQKVNLQVAISNQQIKVGSPIIYGSF